MTTALAYDPTSNSVISETSGERDVAHDLAVVWAVVQLADTMPATIEDRVALAEARSRLLDLARSLGIDEVALARVLADECDRPPGSRLWRSREC